LVGDDAEYRREATASTGAWWIGYAATFPEKGIVSSRCRSAKYLVCVPNGSPTFL
jgi:hypothetical protein